MKILITGGAGFVGANLAVYFAKKGHQVISMDNLSRRGSENALSRFKKNKITFVHGDIRNKEDFLHHHLPTDINVILNTAAEPSAISGYQNPEFVIQTNAIGTLNVLEFARRINSSVIQWSTNKVYCGEKINSIKRKEKKTRYVITDENYKQGIPETFSIDGGDHSIYGLSKIMSDMMCQEYSKAFNIKTVINRFSCLCGPYQWGKCAQGWYAWWAIASYFKLPLQYIGWKGKQVRDILHIDDVTELINLEIENIHKINGEVFNIGGGPKFTMSLIEATEYLKNGHGYETYLEQIEESRKADHCVYVSDIRKAKRILGWKPKINPEEAFDKIISWIKKDKTILKYIYAFK